MRTFVLIALVLSPVVAFNMEVSMSSSLTFDTEAAKNRPVSKVITLLKDMLKQLEKEAEEDEEIYDKMACWCETNDKEKTKSVADAEARISDLKTTIEELSANSNRLNTEIKSLKREVDENQAALDKATALRAKQLAEFNEEEKDLLSSLASMKSAIQVIGQNHGAALIQIPASHLAGVAATVQNEMQKHASLLQGVFTHKERKAIASFVQGPHQGYAPQSGSINGILKQMQDEFQHNLDSTQKEEMTNQKAFEELKAAKEDQIKNGQEQIDTKTQELADTDEKNAQAKVDLQDTMKSLSADEEFVMMLKDKCSMTDGEWEERQKTRQLEMEAVAKANAVLSSDDAHDLFGKTFNSFIQKDAAMNSGRRGHASKLLTDMAKKIQNPRLAALAIRVKLDAFTRVKKAVDDMVAQLLQEKEDEIKHKDYCVEEFNTNDKDTAEAASKKADVEAEIEDLQATKEENAEAIKQLKADVAEMQEQLKRAGEDREKENHEFQGTVADQRATQKLLGAALTILKGFYDKKAKAAFLQTSAPAGPPPPPGFEKYEKNKASTGVMGMIQGIINDAKTMEAETIHSEEDAQRAYEDFVKESNKAIEARSRDIVNKKEVQSKAEKNLVQANKDHDDVETELEELGNTKAELHESCDFVMKNFELRQTARDEEIEALKQAKAILSGAKFDAFLQA